MQFTHVHFPLILSPSSEETLWMQSITVPTLEQAPASHVAQEVFRSPRQKTSCRQGDTDTRPAQLTR